MRDKKVLKSVTKQIIDIDTGEIINQVDVQESRLEVEPPFVKLYIQDIVKLNDLPTAAGKVLNVLVSNMNYGNTVVLIKPIKQKIMEATGLSDNTIKKSIQQLNKANILIRTDRSVYLVDPNIFGKGSWKDIKKIRMILDYNADGSRTINSDLFSQLKEKN